MILHCVYISFRDDASDQDRGEVLDGLSELCQMLEGVLSFEAGPNLDLESKSPEYRHGFVIRFHDQAALETYANHPTHKKLGAGLCDLCIGGADGIIVFDLAV